MQSCAAMQQSCTGDQGIRFFSVNKKMQEENEEKVEEEENKQEEEDKMQTTMQSSVSMQESYTRGPRELFLSSAQGGGDGGGKGRGDGDRRKQA